MTKTRRSSQGLFQAGSGRQGEHATVPQDMQEQVNYPHTVAENGRNGRTAYSYM